MLKAEFFWVLHHFVLKPVFCWKYTISCQNWVLHQVWVEKGVFCPKLCFSLVFVKSTVFLCFFHYFVLKAQFFWVLHHFVLKPAFCFKSTISYQNCVSHQVYVEKGVFWPKLCFSLFCVESRVFLGLTPVCVETCVLLKRNQFLLKIRFCIKSTMRKTFLILNCVFDYFVFKAVFSWVLNYLLLKSVFC